MSLNLSDSIDRIPFVGEHYLRRLARLNINTIGDLVYHFPFRYDDFSRLKKISDLANGETVTIKGTLSRIEVVHTRQKKFITKARLTDRTGQVNLIWFNQPYLSKVLEEGLIINISGKPEIVSGEFVFVSPEYEKAITEPLHTGRLVPIYPETAQVSSKWIRSRVMDILKTIGEIDDPLPSFLKQEADLIDLDQALRTIHFPQDNSQLVKARSRLAFDEIFQITFQSALSQRTVEGQTALLNLNKQKADLDIANLLSRLPFSLTESQREALEEIINDLSRAHPMNRLLQGEVGSGKTIVALAACLAVVKAGHRAILMVPTEILAQQHYQTFSDILNPEFSVKIGLLTGGRIRGTKESQIIIGTQAIIFSQPKYLSSGLIIIDEQHKFGVSQRRQLIELTKNTRVPHVLTMTATPIPRSLALTLFGDLKITSLKEMPKNRKRIKTWYVPETKRRDAYQWLKKQITDYKTQAIIVCPLIEESESETLRSVASAKAECVRIKSVFPEFKIGLLHGQLKTEEKTGVLSKFRAHETQILVATSVVEVGMDIPNLTIMVIEGSERFGLASLHQLRGRVGRSDKQSYCFLFSGNQNPVVIGRLKKMERIDSGLKLAELDLSNRGPGEIFGFKQSGLTTFRIASFSSINLIEKAKKLSQKLIEVGSKKEITKLVHQIAPFWSKIKLN